MIIMFSIIIMIIIIIIIIIVIVVVVVVVIIIIYYYYYYYYYYFCCSRSAKCLNLKSALVKLCNLQKLDYVQTKQDPYLHMLNLKEKCSFFIG